MNLKRKFLDLVKPACPYCDGQSGGSDYWGEWSECPCCNPPRSYNETGRVWIWRVWLYRFELWRLDRWIDRQMRRNPQ
jgi:hypothetical protein